jgi:hypothetical protein
MEHPPFLASSYVPHISFLDDQDLSQFLSPLILSFDIVPAHATQQKKIIVGTRNVYFLNLSRTCFKSRRWLHVCRCCYPPHPTANLMVLLSTMIYFCTHTHRGNKHRDDRVIFGLETHQSQIHNLSEIDNI